MNAWLRELALQAKRLFSPIYPATRWLYLPTNRAAHGKGANHEKALFRCGVKPGTTLIMLALNRKQCGNASQQSR